MPAIPLLPYKFSEKAQRDVEKASAWYDKKQWELGLRFTEYLERSIKKIRRNPEQSMFISNLVQRAILKKFPYQIFFTKQENTTIILRVRHTKQKPLRRFK